MNRHILFALLCVGVIVRSSPAQDYLRSRYYSKARANDLTIRNELQPRYRDDFEIDSSYTNRTTANRESPPRTVTFYRNENRPASRSLPIDDRRSYDRDQRHYASDQYTANRNAENRLVANRYPEVRYPESRYVPHANRYPVRQSGYSQPPTSPPRTSYHRSEFNRAPRTGYAPSWPAHPPRGQVQPRCVQGPTTPPGTYVADGIIGQPILYTSGQPVRNLFRAFGL